MSARLVSMDTIWNTHHEIPRGRSLCDFLNVDFVGVLFVPHYGHVGRYKKKYIVVPRLAYGRGADVTYFMKSSISSLLRGRQSRPLRTMTYSDFMNKIVWQNNWYCSRVVLDV